MCRRMCRLGDGKRGKIKVASKPRARPANPSVGNGRIVTGYRILVAFWLCLRLGTDAGPFCSPDSISTMDAHRDWQPTGSAIRFQALQLTILHPRPLIILIHASVGNVRRPELPCPARNTGHYGRWTWDTEQPSQWGKQLINLRVYSVKSQADTRNLKCIRLVWRWSVPIIGWLLQAGSFVVQLACDGFGRESRIAANASLSVHPRTSKAHGVKSLSCPIAATLSASP